ncbi:MAG: hypothetical protein AAGI66_05690 [Cyanobacteria bacterium P01_H01_bin.74]
MQAKTTIYSPIHISVPTANSGSPKGSKEHRINPTKEENDSVVLSINDDSLYSEEEKEVETSKKPSGPTISSILNETLQKFLETTKPSNNVLSPEMNETAESIFKNLTAPKLSSKKFDPALILLTQLTRLQPYVMKNSQDINLFLTLLTDIAKQVKIKPSIDDLQKIHGFLYPTFANQSLRDQYGEAGKKFLTALLPTREDKIRFRDQVLIPGWNLGAGIISRSEGQSVFNEDGSLNPDVVEILPKRTIEEVEEQLKERLLPIYFGGMFSLETLGA